MRLALIPLALLLALALYVAGAFAGLYGNHRGPGEATQAVIPADELAKRARAQTSAAEVVGVGSSKQSLGFLVIILWCDLAANIRLEFDLVLFQRC